MVVLSALVDRIDTFTDRDVVLIKLLSLKLEPFSKHLRQCPFLF